MKNLDLQCINVILIHGLEHIDIFQSTLNAHDLPLLESNANIALPLFSRSALCLN